MDLTPYVRSLGFELDPWQETLLSQSIHALKPVTFTVRGRFNPGIYDWLLAWIEVRRRARVRAMHSAYRSKARKRRWRK